MDESNGIPQDDMQPSAGGGAVDVDARTVGEQLRRAREAAGLSLNEVAERTKIRPGILADIEADAHDRLPALTYSLGFVKAYARTIGLDATAAGERYRRESHKGDPIPTIVDLQPLEEKRLPSRGLMFGSAALLALAIAGFWAWGAGWFTGSLPPQPSATPAAEQQASVEVTPEAPAAAVPDAQAPVTLTAREEVWLRIADGDESFFMGTMTPGQVMTLPPGRDWTLRTGRAGALAVKVGDTALPPLGGPAEQVRNLSLKPADLLARQAPAAGGLAPSAAIPTAAIPPAAAPAG